MKTITVRIKDREETFTIKEARELLNEIADMLFVKRFGEIKKCNQSSRSSE